jgi:hypothetical protein
MARHLTGFSPHRRRLTLAVSLAGLAVAQCGFPSDETVKADFLKENPSATVLSVGSGEGDGDTVYMIIRFRTSSSAVECAVEWGYQRIEPNSRSFRIFTKGQPSCPGATSSQK